MPSLDLEARRFADRTAFFFNGTCVEIGNTDDLSAGKVADLRTEDYILGRVG